MTTIQEIARELAQKIDGQTDAEMIQAEIEKTLNAVVERQVNATLNVFNTDVVHGIKNLVSSKAIYGSPWGWATLGNILGKAIRDSSIQDKTEHTFKAL
jgi:hypothetical protein